MAFKCHFHSLPFRLINTFLPIASLKNPGLMLSWAHKTCHQVINTILTISTHVHCVFHHHYNCIIFGCKCTCIYCLADYNTSKRICKYCQWGLAGTCKMCILSIRNNNNPLKIILFCCNNSNTHDIPIDPSLSMLWTIHVYWSFYRTQWCKVSV